MKILHIDRLVSAMMVSILLLSPGLHAQEVSNLFHHFHQERSLTYGLNNRRGHLLGDGSTLYGTYVGIAWGDRLKHVFTLNSTVFWVGSEEENPQESVQLHLNFIGLAEEYIFYRQGQFDFSSYIHAGMGKAWFKNNSTNGRPVIVSNQWVIPIELGLQTDYHLNEWLSARMGLGWRWVLKDQPYELDGYYLKLAVGVKMKTLLGLVQERWKDQHNSLTP